MQDDIAISVAQATATLAGVSTAARKIISTVAAEI